MLVLLNNFQIERLGGFVGREVGIILGVLGLGLCAPSGLAHEDAGQTAENPHIEILAAMYGVPGAKHVLDITQKLQGLCGPGAERCSVFCSDSSFGRYNVGYRPICRVTYRCGADEVRSVEASREEPILMRCPERRGTDAAPVAAASH